MNEKTKDFWEQFSRKRITTLRLSKGISKYQMSCDLGRSRGYIYNISAGKTLPSMSEFFLICDYFGISPGEFFNTEYENPVLISRAENEIRALDNNDILLILSLIKRLRRG